MAGVMGDCDHPNGGSSKGQSGSLLVGSDDPSGSQESKH